MICFKKFTSTYTFFSRGISGKFMPEYNCVSKSVSQNILCFKFHCFLLNFAHSACVWFILFDVFILFVSNSNAFHYILHVLNCASSSKFQMIYFPCTNGWCFVIRFTKLDTFREQTSRYWITYLVLIKKLLELILSFSLKFLLAESILKLIEFKILKNAT